jgi:hypothetical protein
MSRPTDEKLYEKIKAEIDRSYDKPSAYRSMAYTRAYLKAYREKYGDDKKAYAGKKPGELKEWRDEKWIDVKSFVKDPVNPIKCGNAPIGKGEYPLCMPIKEAKSYTEGELNLLMKRKNELGKRRLVKDAFLRDVLEPEKIPAERVYKQKYIRDRRLKLAKPLPEKKAEKVLKEPTMREVIKQETKPVEVKEEPIRRPRGRPAFTAEQNIAAAERIKQRKEMRKEEARATFLKEEALRTGKSEIPVPRRFYTEKDKEFVRQQREQEKLDIEARRKEREESKKVREERLEGRKRIRSAKPLQGITISEGPVTFTWD